MTDTTTTAARPPVPYNSPAARTLAAQDLFNGEQSLFHPDEFKKDDAACPLSDLLFEIGRASARERNELHDAHAAIPDEIAPRKEGTLGEKTPLAERIKALLEKLAKSSASFHMMNRELLETRRQNTELKQEVDRLRSLEQDAARYRYLRDRDVETDFPRAGLFIGKINNGRPDEVVTKDDADAAIDAARIAEAERKTDGQR